MRSRLMTGYLTRKRMVRVALVVTLCAIGLGGGSLTGWAADGMNAVPSAGLVVSQASETPGTAQAPENPAANPATPFDGIVKPVDPEQMQRFEQQGFTQSDIQTANSLMQRSGIPMERWLAARKQGREWPEIIADLTDGMPLPRTKVSPDGRDLTEAETRALVDGGYLHEDIEAVGKLLWRYGGDPWALLAQRQAGKSWEEIEREIVTALRQEREKKPNNGGPRFDLGEDRKGTATPSGLTKEEIYAFLARGYTLAEVISADARAFSFGLDIREIEAAKRPDLSLLEAVDEARSAARQPQGQLCSLPTKAGLTEAEVNQLKEAGYTATEIANADDRAYGLGMDLRSILAMRQPGEALKDLVVRAENQRTPAERAAWLKGTDPSEEERITYYATTTGRSEEEVRALRAARKAWVEIGGVKTPDGQMTQYDLADSWGITDHILVERAGEMGLSVVDVLHAVGLADLYGQPVEDVLALKTSSNTWKDVRRILDPNQP